MWKYGKPKCFGRIDKHDIDCVECSSREVKDCMKETYKEYFDTLKDGDNT